MAKVPAKKADPFKTAVAEFAASMVHVVEGNNMALASGDVRAMRSSLAALQKAAAGPAAADEAEAEA